MFSDNAPSGSNQQKDPVVVHVPRVTARTLPGPASPQNKGAIDWGGHGLLAYGTNYTVVVVDTKNIQPVQCLDRHKSMVNMVLWGRDYLSKDRTTPSATQLCNNLDLVSSDTTGHIVVWDISTGAPTAVLQDGSKPVLDMEWVTGWDNSHHILASLHPPYSLILWDTRTGIKLWKKTYTENLLSFNFDPFHSSKMAFLCTDCILFVEDFSVSRIPSSNGKKFYISSPRTAVGSSGGSRGSLTNIATQRGSLTNLTSTGQEQEKQGTTGTKDRFRRLMKDLVIGENKPRPDEGLSLGECLQVLYHRSLRYHLLLLYPRELLLLDLHINQTVGIIPLGDKASSPFLQVVSCKQRDVLYCLHENGCVSAKVRRRPVLCSPLDAPAHSIASLELNTENQLEIGYEHRCTSEPVRQTRGLQILGLAVNPVCERRLCLYLNSGKIVFLELLPASGESPPLFTLNLNGVSGVAHIRRNDTLSGLLPPLIMEQSTPIPAIRLLVTGLLPSVMAPLTCIRMCPAITTRNWKQYSPLLAGGSTAGLIQVYNVATGNVEKEFVVHAYTVRGIEWTGLKTFLSYAYANQTSSNSPVRNELCLTDVETGETTIIRSDKGDEQPLDILRVSPLKQYFIIVLKDGPFELWDLKSRHLLRVMPKKFKPITALEWSPAHAPRSLRRRQSSKDECAIDLTPTTPSAEKTLPTFERQESSEKLVAKEHFVFSDTESQLYHFTVEGHGFKDCLKIPPENGIGVITCIAFKADQIVQGDADGLLSVWDLRTKQARRHSTSRGLIKKMKFAPGKGNLKLILLFSDGIDIIDLKGTSGFERIAQLKCPRDMVKVLDVDWAASDKPVLATQDGCLRVMDMGAVTSTSPIVEYELQDQVYCPALLPTETAFKLKERLRWQPAGKPFTTELTMEHGFTEQQLSIVNEQLTMIDTGWLEHVEKTSLGTAERSLMVAQLFGDIQETDFWTVVLYYLQVTRANRNVQEDDQSTENHSVKFNSSLVPLDTCYDILQDPATYHRLQLERVALHESRRGDYEHTKLVIRQLILLGQGDRAVQLLLETDLANSQYYTDAIKACLVATVQSTGAAQSTIKLVATNLIAHGNIWEGVQLLCLIGKGLDACRYLASYSRWGAAAWLARTVLPNNESCEVIRKLADRFVTIGQKEKAVLVLVSLEQWDAAHELLSSYDPARAALLAQSCQDFGFNITKY